MSSGSQVGESPLYSDLTGELRELLGRSEAIKSVFGLFGVLTSGILVLEILEGMSDIFRGIYKKNTRGPT